MNLKKQKMFSDRIERESKVAILLSRSCDNVTLLMLYLPPGGGIRYIATTFHLKVKVNKKKVKSVDEILKIKNIKKALNW